MNRILSNHTDDNEIADMCRKTAEASFLTKNGTGLMAIDIETYNRREKMSKLHEELPAVEEDRIAGKSALGRRGTL
mgnify:FL=1